MRAMLAVGLSAAAALSVPSKMPSRVPHMPKLAQPDAVGRRQALQTIGGLGTSLCMMPAPSMAAADTLKYFPGSLTSEEIDTVTAAALGKRGYTPANTLFATSLCSDEVNYVKGEMADRMKNRWGESFALGGLAGVPFAGKAGMGAYAHHVPDEGKLFIVFAPHVGVGLDGKVGALERRGQGAISNACGAGIGAYKALTKADSRPPESVTALDDTQIQWIMLKLAPKLAGINAAPDDIAFVTYRMYEVVRDAMILNIQKVPGIWQDCSELCLLGGVQINRAAGGDAFQPLFFQATNKEGTVTDLYEDTFGDYPDLAKVLGSSFASEMLLTATL